MKTKDMTNVCKKNGDCKNCEFNIPNLGKNSCQLINLAEAFSTLNKCEENEKIELIETNIKR